MNIHLLHLGLLEEFLGHCSEEVEAKTEPSHGYSGGGLYGLTPERVEETLLAYPIDPTDAYHRSTRLHSPVSSHIRRIGFSRTKVGSRSPESAVSTFVNLLVFPAF